MRKKKFLNNMEEKEFEIICSLEKIIFLGIKKESYKIFNLNGQNKFQVISNFEKTKEKKRKYNIINK